LAQASESGRATAPLASHPSTRASAFFDKLGLRRQPFGDVAVVREAALLRQLVTIVSHNGRVL
jgi:hypothetical protein